MDEGIVPPQPSPASLTGDYENGTAGSWLTRFQLRRPSRRKPSNKNSTGSTDDVKAFGVLLSGTDNNAFTRRRWHPAMVVAAVVLLIAGVGVPWALYTRQQAARKASEPTTATATTPTPVDVPTPDETQLEVAPATESSTDTEAAELARRQREARIRERARLEQAAIGEHCGPKRTLCR